MGKIIEIKLKKTPSPEEIKIVQMIGEDKFPQEIADELGKGVREIYDTVTGIRKKYGCKTPAGLAILFFRNNLIK